MGCSDITTSTSIFRPIIVQGHGSLILWRHIDALCLALPEILCSRRHHRVLPHASPLLHHHDQGHEGGHEDHDHDIADDAAGAAGESEAEDTIE